jgi:hypothetical protein
MPYRGLPGVIDIPGMTLCFLGVAGYKRAKVMRDALETYLRVVPRLLPIEQHGMVQVMINEIAEWIAEDGAEDLQTAPCAHVNTPGAGGVYCTCGEPK